MSFLRLLAAELSARDDSSLRSLFVLRPDLISPPVPDFAALAARACTRASLGRALDRLDQPHLQVLEALLLTTDEDRKVSGSAGSLSGSIPGSTAPALARLLYDLEEQALVYHVSTGSGTSTEYLPIGNLRDVIGAHPGSLGRRYSDLLRVAPLAIPAITSATVLLAPYGLNVPADGTAAAPVADAALALSDWLASPGALDALLSTAPERSTTILNKLAQHPVGSVPHAAHPASPPNPEAGPVDWLCAHALIVPIGTDTVELPFEVGLALRGGAIITGFSADPPVPTLSTSSAAVVSNAALSATSELLRNLAALLDAISTEPVGTLRNGGVGVREVRRLGEAAGCPADLTPFLLELAAAARLVQLNVDTSRWESGSAAAAWLDQPRPAQWLQLAGAWLDADRAPALIGQPGARGVGIINALSADVHRADAPGLRRVTMAALVALAAGQESAERCVTPTREQVLARARWNRPRLARRLRKLMPGFLSEATVLGILGSGALSPAGAVWCDGDAQAAVELLQRELPKPVDRVLLQADLTAVAPGYLDAGLSRELRLLADAEGQGPATIYRFSSASLRRALAAGREEADIRHFLTQHSATPIPQPLDYLVRDTASRYGALRTGPASSYLVARDPSTLPALLEVPALRRFGLRLLAPTVLVSSAPFRELSATLTSLGLHAAVDVSQTEDGGQAPQAAPGTGAQKPGGAVAVASWPVPGALPPVGEDPEHQIAALRAKPFWTPTGPEAGTQLGLEILQRAIRLKEHVRITLVDSNGNAERLELVPLSLSGGRVRVFDPRRSTERVVSIHRVMEVEPL